MLKPFQFFLKPDALLQSYVSELCHGDGIAEALALQLDAEITAEIRTDIKQ